MAALEACGVCRWQAWLSLSLKARRPPTSRKGQRTESQKSGGLSPFRGRVAALPANRSLALPLDVFQESVDELGRVAEQRFVIAELVLKLAQRRDEGAAFR